MKPKSTLVSIRALRSLTLALMLSVVWGFASGQAIKVSGRVSDSGGSPLAGVTVVIQGATAGAVTNAKGEYSINVPDEHSVLRFVYTGMVAVTEKVGTRKTINVAMREDVTTLEDVIVDIGYGTTRKTDFTGALSSITGEDLKRIPVASAAEALTGKIAGLQITTTEGSPGAEIKLRVRGTGTITQDASPLYIIDGFPSDLGISSVDPSQIESVIVLKDASSTAIYGARGANGVILITTRSGKAGHTRVSYNGYAGFRQTARFLDVMNPYDYVVLQFEQAGSDANDIAKAVKRYGAWDQVYENYYGNKGIFWQEEVYGRDAIIQNHNVNLEGGSELTRVNASFSYNDEQGTLITTGSDKMMFKIKVNHTTMNKKVKLAMDASYLESAVVGDRQYGKSGKLISAVMMRPVNNIDGTLEDLLDEDMDDNLSGGSASEWMANPAVQEKSEYKKRTTKNTFFNGSADWSILKTLNFKASGGLMYQTTINDWAFYNKNTRAKSDGGPSAGISHEDRRKWNAAFTLTYNEKICRKHNIQAMIGNEEEMDNKRTLGASASHFESDAIMLDNLSLGRTFGLPTSIPDESSMASFFARVNYNFDERYIFTASVRRDGTSVFHASRHWGTFPSAAAAWRIDRERFMRGVSWVDNLKLRASYGQAGNNRIPSDQWQKIYSYGYYGINDAMETSASTNALYNPNLRWEALTSRDLGVDFGLFRGRISGVVDLYINSSDDLLLKADVNPVSGFTTQYKNIGSTENKGIEITLNTVNVRTKQFTWSTDFNISFNKNRIKHLNGEDRMFAASGFFHKDIGNDFVAIVGQPLGNIWGYEVHPNLFYRAEDFEADPANPGKYRLKPGIPYMKDTTPQPGMVRFKDQGDGKSMINQTAYDSDGNPYTVSTPLIDTDNDRTVIGNTQPKFFGGFNNTFTYKGWDLGIFLNFVYGNDVLNGNRFRFTSGYKNGQNMLSEMRHRFLTISPSGEKLVTSAMSYSALEQLAVINKDAKIWSPIGELDRVNSWNVEDGSFIRLNNLTLGYTFPKRWINHLGLQNLRVYFTGYNLAIWTSYSGFDPEVDTHSSSNPMTQGVDYSAYPRSSQYIFGLNVTF